MDIRSYLCREAARISDASLSSLPAAADWAAECAERRTVYLDRMALSGYLDAPRTPLNLKVTGTLERDGYTVEKIFYESLPGLYVTANLYVPTGLKAPAPAVAYFCGHSLTQKINYQAHPRRWAQLGFVTIVVDTVQFGEIRGDHHGTWSQGRFHWYSRGYSPASVECWNGIRALDILAQRDDVDEDRMGITGISGGGGMSWWLGAADERVKVVAPVCGTGTMRSHVAERTVDGHCDCMYHINPDGWDLADVGALIAPRPLLIASADYDGIYKIDSVRETYEKLRRLYALLGAEDRIQLVETPGEHSYHERSRTRIFSLFLKELAGKEVPPETVGDIDPDKNESDENILRVFVPGTQVVIPSDERSTTIDDTFIPRAAAVPIEDEAGLRARREAVVAGLRNSAYAQFPSPQPALDLEIHQHTMSKTSKGVRFRFSSEDGWRLTGSYARRLDFDGPRGVVLNLRSPGEAKWASEGFVGKAVDRFGVAHVEVRGCGEHGWSEELSWHVRRASAIIGRTVTSMQTYDVLRALQAVRQLEGVDSRQVILAARGPMCVAALGAALLDGQVHAVALGEPPASLDLPSQPDGRGPATELLGALRVTDLPEMAALLWPAHLVFVGWRPTAYEFAEAVYERLAEPGVVRHVKALEDYR